MKAVLISFYQLGNDWVAYQHFNTFHNEQWACCQTEEEVIKACFAPNAPRVPVMRGQGTRVDAVLEALVKNS